MALRDGNGSFKVGLEKSESFGVGGKSRLAEISDFGDRDRLFSVAHRTGMPWDTFARIRRSQSKLGIQRHDILSLIGPKAVARRAAVPLSVARPFTISHRYAVLVARQEAALLPLASALII